MTAVLKSRLIFLRLYEEDCQVGAVIYISIPDDSEYAGLDEAPAT